MTEFKVKKEHQFLRGLKNPKIMQWKNDEGKFQTLKVAFLDSLILNCTGELREICLPLSEV